MKLRVRANRRVTPDLCVMELAWEDALGTPRPGQFVMVRLREGTDPIWRRPFGVHDFRRARTGPVLALLYQVVGPTTRAMAACVRGDAVDVLGPFGRGFALEAEEHWLVAGGRGLAPLFYLAREVRRAGRACRVMAGGRGGEHIARAADLDRLGCAVEIVTEDGSRGERGLVTKPLARALRALRAGRKPAVRIAACGPEPMLRAVAGLAARAGVAAQVSVDPLMACGQGLCQGCAVRGRDGYRLACQDGPVFDARELYG